MGGAITGLVWLIINLTLDTIVIKRIEDGSVRLCVRDGLHT